MDAYFSRALKNWAARKQPPQDMRARLLEAADAEASLPPKLVLARRPQPYRYPIVQASFGHLLMSNMSSHNLTLITLKLT